MFRSDRTNSYFALIALACLMFAGLGCNLADRLRAGNGSSSDGPSTDRPTIGSSKNGKRMYEDEAALADFIADLKSTLGTDDPKVLDLLVYDSYITAKVQDPKKPENIDGYTYKDGSLEKPVPVKIIGNGKIIAAGSVEELKAKEVKQLRVSVQTAEDLTDALPGTVTRDGDDYLVEDGDDQEVLRIAAAAGRVTHFAYDQPTIAEIFREAVTR